jgi:hypothetical protein
LQGKKVPMALSAYGAFEILGPVQNPLFSLFPRFSPFFSRKIKAKR